MSKIPVLSNQEVMREQVKIDPETLEAPHGRKPALLFLSRPSVYSMLLTI
jgi:hypothetical protein